MAQRTPVERSIEAQAASERVIEAVADRTGTDPAALEPLYSVVDPDALDALVERSRPGSDPSLPRISFTYCGCDVVVSADGQVQVTHTRPSG